MAVRWGILGCGAVCEVKSGPAFQKAEGSELVAVMRRDRARAEDYAQRHGVSTVYDDADALIADPNVSAVYIAAPPGAHLELALKVAAAGKPAYVEKPMARSHAECLRMIEAFERARQPLFVAFYRRALPRFIKAKELVESGLLGELKHVDIRYASNGQSKLDPQALPWRVKAEHAGAGLFLDLASHTLDALDFMLGPLAEARGEARHVSAPGDVEDRVSLTFETRHGARGNGDWNFSSPVYEDNISIEGTRGMLRLSTFGESLVELETSGGSESFRLPNPQHIQQPLIQSIVNALRGSGDCPSTGYTAARTSAVMDSALVSYYGSRGDGFWKEPAAWPGRRA